MQEGSSGGCDGGGASDEKSATQILAEHKARLKEERSKKVLIERQMAKVPKLGRGFATGNSFSELWATMSLLTCGDKSC